MICKLYFPLLSLRTVNTVSYGYNTLAVLPTLFLAKDRQKPGRLFQISIIFLLFILCHILCLNFLVKRVFQGSAHNVLIIDSEQIRLNFFLHFSFIILTHVLIYCRAVVQTLSRLNGQEFL